jgi:ubiquinone/menaquinone biosynthesis C-methylase UbiE
VGSAVGNANVVPGPAAIIGVNLRTCDRMCIEFVASHQSCELSSRGCKTMPDVTPEPIMKVALGFMAAKHLFAASEIGLFEALADGPATVEELAGKTAVPARTVGIVAAAMVSLGLIDQEGGRYRNSEAAATFLAGKPGHDVRPVLRFFNSIGYPLWERFADAVRSGEGQAQFGKFDREQQQIFSAGVEALTAPVAGSLAVTYDFGSHKQLLDIGGGTGSFLLAVLRRYPGLRGTLFELPGACAVARQRLSAEPEGTRIDIVEGDMFKTPLPANHDVLLVANTVHVLSAPHNLELMGKMRATVQRGARLLLVDFWMNPTHTEPPAAALMSGEFLVMAGEGQAYSEQEADHWLKQTGWRKHERKPLAGMSSVIVAEAA